MRKTILAALLASSAVFSLPAVCAIYVDIAPPAPRYEVVPAPRAGYVWVPGYWDWRGHRHVWTRGHWERERHGFYFHPNRWVEREPLRPGQGRRRRAQPRRSRAQQSVSPVKQQLILSKLLSGPPLCRGAALFLFCHPPGGPLR